MKNIIFVGKVYKLRELLEINKKQQTKHDKETLKEKAPTVLTKQEQNKKQQINYNTNIIIQKQKEQI